MTKILITGGAGFIPSSLADKLLLENDNMIILVDNLITGELSKVPVNERCKFIKCDVNKYNDIAPIMTSFSLIMYFIMPLWLA